MMLVNGKPWKSVCEKQKRWKTIVITQKFMVSFWHLCDGPTASAFTARNHQTDRDIGPCIPLHHRAWPWWYGKQTPNQKGKESRSHFQLCQKLASSIQLLVLQGRRHSKISLIIGCGRAHTTLLSPGKRLGTAWSQTHCSTCPTLSPNSSAFTFSLVLSPQNMNFHLNISWKNILSSTWSETLNWSMNNSQKILYNAKRGVCSCIHLSPVYGGHFPCCVWKAPFAGKAQHSTRKRARHQRDTFQMYKHSGAPEWVRRVCLHLPPQERSTLFRSIIFNHVSSGKLREDGAEGRKLTDLDFQYKYTLWLRLNSQFDDLMFVDSCVYIYPFKWLFKDSAWKITMDNFTCERLQFEEDKWSVNIITFALFLSSLIGFLTKFTLWWCLQNIDDVWM